VKKYCLEVLLVNLFLSMLRELEGRRLMARIHTRLTILAIEIMLALKARAWLATETVGLPRQMIRKASCQLSRAIKAVSSLRMMGSPIT
jgi:hypothetical protein